MGSFSTLLCEINPVDLGVQSCNGQTDYKINFNQKEEHII